MLLYLGRTPLPSRYQRLYPKHLHIDPRKDQWWEQLQELDGKTPIAIEHSEHWPSHLIQQSIETLYPQRFQQLYLLDITEEFEKIAESDDLDYHRSPSILDCAQMAPPPGWFDVFEKALPEIKQISKVISEQKMAILPSKTDLFRAFHLTPLSRVRVVIIGQDPYPNLDSSGLPQAMGLSFSVRRGVPVPRSLRNIYAELTTDIKGFKEPNHGDLTAWAKQGVLLLNMSLTCPLGQAGGHSRFGVWMPLHKHVFDAIADINPKCIYVLWGKEAGKVRRHLGGQSIIIESAHPSPLSAKSGFFGSKPFSKINSILKEQPIDWQV